MIPILIAILMSQWTVDQVRDYMYDGYYSDVVYADSINGIEGWCEIDVAFYESRIVAVRDILSHAEVLELQDWFYNIEMISHGEDSVLLVCEAKIYVRQGSCIPIFIED